MTGLSLSLPLPVVIPVALLVVLWLFYQGQYQSLYTSPQSPIPKAKLMTFHKHYKQTNDKLKEENISLKYIIKR